MNNRRRATPPRIGPPEEVYTQLYLRGTAEHGWLTIRGWRGAKLAEIVQMRSKVRADTLTELSHRLEEASRNSDIAEKRIRRATRVASRPEFKGIALGSPTCLRNRRIALKFQADFKRARMEMSELTKEMFALGGPPTPNWILKRRVKPCPEVEELVNKVDEMAIDGPKSADSL
ncbi:hypothetical protein V5O48_005825 [Marasmius crinis-equi]|uniref:Uncharacterized protein n=1 Tax=Marasmius crinis-equi TaxID=585013 RepID=A0ABR3FLF4_9AGAR